MVRGQFWMTRCHQAETCCKQASFLPVDRAALSGGARVPGGVPPLLGSPPHPRQGGMCPCSGLAPGGLCPRGSNGIASPLHSAQASPALSTQSTQDLSDDCHTSLKPQKTLRAQLNPCVCLTLWILNKRPQGKMVARADPNFLNKDNFERFL